MNVLLDWYGVLPYAAARTTNHAHQTLKIDRKVNTALATPIACDPARAAPTDTSTPLVREIMLPVIEAKAMNNVHLGEAYNSSKFTPQKQTTSNESGTID